jgi:glutamate/tyrosine decarboxylase-like PLP-dependent enzyme
MRPLSELQSDTMKALLSDAHVRSVRYLESLASRSVEPTEDALTRLRELETPLPEDPVPPADVFRRLDELGSPATIANAGPRYFGFVTGGALPVSLAANWLAGAWDQNAHFVVGSPVAATLENTTLAWIREILGLADTWGGGFVTGTTMGNFSGLAAGRHKVLADVGWDVEANGLFGAPEIKVVVGEEAHTTLLQGLALVGFGRERVIKVPVDDQGRMRADAFPELAGPSIVCLQAGNVNSGSFDPIQEIASRARGAGAWVHLDGAFGLWAKASPAYAHLVEGITEVDSIATDLHKWLNVPYDAGLALYRDPEMARNALSITAAYLPTGEQRQPCDYTPESSRRARGVEVWAALASMGRSGLADLVERNCRYARRFADGLKDAGFEILNDVVLNQVLVAFGNAERTQDVITATQREGTCWCSGTTWKGRAAMRISISSWATTEDDVDKSLEAIIKIAS